MNFQVKILEKVHWLLGYVAKLQEKILVEVSNSQSWNLQDYLPYINFTGLLCYFSRIHVHRQREYQT